MEEKKLHLDAPFLSARHTKKTTTRRRKLQDSCQETKHETPVRSLQDYHIFDHVIGPTLTKESDLIKALDMVSSTASYGEQELKKSGRRISNIVRDNAILENRDLMMSIVTREKKESWLVEEYKKEKKRSIALERVSMALNQDLQNVDDDDDDYHEDHHHKHVYSNVSKKALFGLCSKNSVDVLIPILSRVKTCQNLGVKPEKMVNPKSLSSVKKTNSSSQPRVLRSNRVMTKPQEQREISLSKPGETIRMPKHSSRLQGTRSINQIQRQEQRFLVRQEKRFLVGQEKRFLAGEVKRRRNMNKIRSGNLYGISVSQLPLPKTPSESWLCRTLPRSVATSIVSSQATGLKKRMMIDQKTTNPQSIKWETIVKHHDHARYTKELDVVQPSRQSKF